MGERRLFANATCPDKETVCTVKFVVVGASTVKREVLIFVPSKDAIYALRIPPTSIAQAVSVIVDVNKDVRIYTSLEPWLDASETGVSGHHKDSPIWKMIISTASIFVLVGLLLGFGGKFLHLEHHGEFLTKVLKPITDAASTTLGPDRTVTVIRMLLWFAALMAILLEILLYELLHKLGVWLVIGSIAIVALGYGSGAISSIGSWLSALHRPARKHRHDWAHCERFLVPSFSV